MTDLIARLGIMGGTFDPIHYGHLRIAEAAREALGLSHVVFVPAGQPALVKSHQVSEAEHRAAMTALAVSSNPAFSMSRVEIERAGPSYALDTVRALAGNAAPGELYFITGADALLDLHRWREPEALLRECHLVAVARPGVDMAAFREGGAGWLAGKVSLLPAPGLEISSTGLRESVRAGRSIKYLTPELVEAYIARHNLYSPRH